MNAPVDLRSDTVTRPSAAMRAAMARAEVGDDVFGDDPTVRTLEEEVADLLGKDQGLLLPSGTMSNVAALLALTEALPRDRPVLVGRHGHVLRYERHGAAALGGIPVIGVPERADGALDPGALAAELDDCASTGTPAAAVVLENTHNRLGGTPVSAAATADCARLAREHGAVLHLDGARLLNAAVALATPPAVLAADAGTVALSLSKGLGAPAGSVLAGPVSFVDAARRARKMLGGALHQAGVLAAAGLVGLRDQRDRLAEDHALAAELASGLAARGVEVEPVADRTNMVVARSAGGRAPELVAALAREGVLALPLDRHRIRMVTHRDVGAAGVARAVAAAAWSGGSARAPAR